MKKQTKKISQEREKTANEIIADLKKYSKKCNAMMIESVNGKAPQILKIILLRRLLDSYFYMVNKKYTKEKIDKAEELVDRFIKIHGRISTTTNKKEAEKNAY